MLKREWIRNPSKVLIIQVHRVDYDPVNKKPVKNNKTFLFDEVLFIDQFLERNRHEVMELDIKNNELDTQLKSLEFQLNQFTAFGPQKVNILAALSTVTYFLTQQSNYKEIGSKLYDKKMAKVDKKNFSQGYDSLTANFNMLQKNKEDVIKSKRMLYDKLKKTRYNLKGIIIHSGDNSYGHYYAYIKNNDRWWHFNDRVVTEVDKKRVFDDAFGYIYEDSNVYCLIYTHESLNTDFHPSSTNLSARLLTYVNEKNKELRLNELEKQMDDLIVKMQSIEINVRNSVSFIEFRKIIPRIENFEIFCIDTVNIGVTSPSLYMDAMRVNILDELLKKVKFEDPKVMSLSYSVLKSNPEVYKALQKALIKYRIDLPEPSENYMKSLKKLRNDYIATIKAIIVLGTAAQSLMPRSVHEYINLLAFYFEIQPFGILQFNSQHYKILKENTLYFILEAFYLKKTQKLYFNLHDFVTCLRTCLHILAERKFMDRTVDDFTDHYICYLIDDMNVFIAGYPNWNKITELATFLKTSSTTKQSFILPSLEKTDYIKVNLQDCFRRSRIL